MTGEKQPAARRANAKKNSAGRPAAADPRRAAVQALLRQEQDGYANLVLAAALRRFHGDARDRAFFGALFYGTVERLYTIDYILNQVLAKPAAKADPTVRAILRSGLYQARWMDSVPVHAAVNESVSLAKKLGRGGSAGLVNAVLRKAAGFDLAAAQFSDETQRLSVLYSVSPPIAALLAAQLPAEAEDVLRASFEQPQLAVRVNTLKTTPEALRQRLAEAGVAAQCGALPNSLVLTGAGDVTALEAFREGLFHVQGLASQLACAALAVQPHETVLDVCAAPGGKSATLAQQMGDTGALFSCDVVESRLSLIEGAFARLGVTCGRVLQNDASQPSAALPRADAVLCDVPCSGLGVLGKKPDIRCKTLEGLESLVQLQQKILEASAALVKHGGRLVYSTCTLNENENAGVVRAFLAAHPEFCAEALPVHLAGEAVAENLVTLLPNRTHTDGFFVALLRKN